MTHPTVTDLERDLAAVLNRYSAENGSDTPDFVLATFLMTCLDAFDAATMVREDWYGRAETHPAVGRSRLVDAYLAVCAERDELAAQLDHLIPHRQGGDDVPAAL